MGRALKELLWHQVFSRQSGGLDDGFVVLSVSEIDLFVATGPQFDQDNNNDFGKIIYTFYKTIPGYFLLRCHYDKAGQRLVWGYHQQGQQCHQEDNETSTNPPNSDFTTFHHILDISLHDDNWRLITVLTNLARILHCRKAYSVPLVWQGSDRRSLVDQGRCVEKVYHGGTIDPQIKATVSNMIDMYQKLAQAQVPYVDRLVSVVRSDNIRHNNGSHKENLITCRFAPVGRAYLPFDWSELLGALLCVTKAALGHYAS